MEDSTPALRDRSKRAAELVADAHAAGSQERPAPSPDGAGSNAKVNAVATQVLDVRGLQCPLPVLRANKVLKGLAAGDELEVLASDPAAPRDFVGYCATTGHVLVESRAADGVFTIVLRKAG